MIILDTKCFHIILNHIKWIVMSKNLKTLIHFLFITINTILFPARKHPYSGHEDLWPKPHFPQKYLTISKAVDQGIGSTSVKPTPISTDHC